MSTNLGVTIPIRVCIAGATGRAGHALARELAERLSKIHPSELAVPLEQTQVSVESRGALIANQKVNTFIGLRVGLDSILGLEP